MSVLISGVLMNPAGVPVSGAEVTFSALTSGPSVLNGFSASVMTDQDGNYAISLEICEYAISIQSDGYNSVYGSVSINEKSTPATINELLKLAAMEQAVTPAIIVYFREIQSDVAAKLAAMQVLGTNAAEAASAAATARDEAAQYAQNLSVAVAQAQQASAAATASANAASNSANGALVAKDAAETAAGNAQATLDNAMLKGQFGWGGDAVIIPDQTNVLDYFSQSPASGVYRCFQPQGITEGLASVFLFTFTKWNVNHATLVATSLGQTIQWSLQNTFQDGAWKGWAINWNSSSLPNPATTDTVQTITGYKTIRRDWAGINITPNTRGAPSYFQGSESDGTTRFYLGQDGNNVNHVVWWNSRTSSGISLNQGAVNVAAPTLTVGDKPVLTVDSVAPPRQLHNAAVYGGQAIRIKLKFTYSGGGAGCLLRIVGGSGFNGRTDQQWVATLHVRAGNSAGDGQFSAILNTDFGANPVSQLILLPDPDDWNAVFVHFVHGTIYPGDTTINLVNKFFIDLAQSDIGGTVVNVADIPSNGRLPTLINRAWTTLNTTVDGNGNIKSASPIVKLFADGSSELNAESEGIVTTRLSEGVYHITGCLGLNADRAWGGDDGGITNPKCRNGYERIWNDYDVQEDGSLIIRTYHRVHSDAMPFAQNRLNLDHRPYNEKRDSEEWPDRALIDIPLGTYLTVRVQMPAREEKQYVPATRAISHSNVYCNSVSPT